MSVTPRKYRKTYIPIDEPGSIYRIIARAINHVDKAVKHWELARSYASAGPAAEAERERQSNEKLTHGLPC